MLLGRRTECETLDRTVEAVRTGESRALVIRGDPGIGKTALLEYLRERASGCRVTRVAGIQPEMELAYAALHQLCAPMLDRLQRLPEPQRDALETAFGIRAGPAPDRFLVGLPVLGLLAETAEEQPLVCLVDDAQWLDRASAQALALAARRLFAKSVAVVFATRAANGYTEPMGLPELVVGGLEKKDAQALLSSVTPVVLDENVRERIIAETHGNPLAILELPRALSPAELASGLVLPAGPGLAGRIENSFARRVAVLPPDTQRLLLVAAAEPLGDPALVWRAAERLGIGIDAAAPAAAAGLCESGARLRFRHPLVRSAVYHAASPEDRRSVHRALAEATDSEVGPDRIAWHRAQAATGPDEQLAAELERSADRAQARGGLAAAAAFLQQAAGLTVDPVKRAGRALAAARAKHLAGAPTAAEELLDAAQAGPLGEFQRARVALLRAQISFAVNRGSEAPPLLLKAAKRLEPLDVALARDTYLEAFGAVMFAGRLAAEEIANAALAGPPAPDPPRASDLLLDGLATRFSNGFVAAVPTLKRALGAFSSPSLPPEEGLHWLWLAVTTATELWDDAAWERCAIRCVELVREAGAFVILPIALSTLSAVHVYAGELDAGAALVEEAEAVTEATGSELGPHAALTLAAIRGREAKVIELGKVLVGEVHRRGEDIGLAVVHWTTSVLYNGLGRYEEALTSATQATKDLERGGLMWALPELVEAAVRSDHADTARLACDRLSERTQASGTDWALGIEARSRALLSEGEGAERLYREAIQRLRRTRVRAELARAHLLYGEWLRRQRRRLDAREQLRTAHEMLLEMGHRGVRRARGA